MWGEGGRVWRAHRQAWRAAETAATRGLATAARPLVAAGGRTAKTDVVAAACRWAVSVVGGGWGCQGGMSGLWRGAAPARKGSDASFSILQLGILAIFSLSQGWLHPLTCLASHYLTPAHWPAHRIFEDAAIFSDP